jgi:hypothetical protein
MYVPFSVFCVLFVCKCVLYYCHRVSTRLQLNISYIIHHNVGLLLAGWSDVDSGRANKVWRNLQPPASHKGLASLSISLLPTCQFDWQRAGRSGDRIPVGDEIFRTRPNRPWGPRSLLYNGYRVFPGGKAAGAWCWPPTPSSAEVKKE